MCGTWRQWMTVLDFCKYCFCLEVTFVSRGKFKLKKCVFYYLFIFFTLINLPLSPVWNPKTMSDWAKNFSQSLFCQMTFLNSYGKNKVKKKMVFFHSTLVRSIFILNEVSSIFILYTLKVFLKVSWISDKKPFLLIDQNIKKKKFF